MIFVNSIKLSKYFLQHNFVKIIEFCKNKGIERKKRHTKEIASGEEGKERGSRKRKRERGHESGLGRREGKIRWKGKSNKMEKRKMRESRDEMGEESNRNRIEREE